MKTDDFLSCRDKRDEEINNYYSSHYVKETRNQYGYPGHPARYRCLLRCEGEKTYSHSGFCPDCNTKMVMAVEGRHPV